ncbi:MAG TPA: HAD-IA family hydrolase [Allosphingosinicella sp.]|uniref:HAD-IA family hydrolase n=1 Tax=Allosphingosinicella sp. TaxID=2823234 RepID=UPI002F27EC80
MTNRLAIFDCDGTLVDSGANICLAMEECFARADLPVPAPERTRSVVGLSLVEAMRAMLPGAEPQVHAALAEDYKHTFQRLRGRGLVEEPLYDGVSELIDELDRGDWLLGVATGKSDRGLSLCLDHHRLSHRFVTLQTADRHPSKPHPSMIETAMAEAGAVPETTVMIGDTSYDMAMARAAGVLGIGVSWGYHAREELLAAGADYIADHPSEIAELVSSLR